MTANNEQNQSSQNDMRTRLLTKIIPIIRKNGFQSIRMDDMAKYMDVSKATMYKYFTSKEDVIQGSVNSFVDYLNELVVESNNTVESFTKGFQQSFEQSILLAAYISDVFLNELQIMYPYLHDQLRDAMQRREEKMTVFYEEGKEKGIFNTVNEKLIFLQDDVLVRSMIDAKFLMLNGLTLHQLLLDYYRLKKLQLFKADHAEQVDDNHMVNQLDYISKKLTRDLF